MLKILEKFAFKHANILVQVYSCNRHEKMLEAARIEIIEVGGGGTER
jgi:hypothetical protein